MEHALQSKVHCCRSVPVCPACCPYHQEGSRRAAHCDRDCAGWRRVDCVLGSSDAWDSRYVLGYVAFVQESCVRGFPVPMTVRCHAR